MKRTNGRLGLRLTSILLAILLFMSFFAPTITFADSSIAQQPLEVKSNASEDIKAGQKSVLKEKYGLDFASLKDGEILKFMKELQEKEPDKYKALLKDMTAEETKRWKKISEPAAEESGVSKDASSVKDTDVLKDKYSFDMDNLTDEDVTAFLTPLKDGDPDRYESILGDMNETQKTRWNILSAKAEQNGETSDAAKAEETLPEKPAEETEGETDPFADLYGKQITVTHLNPLTEDKYADGSIFITEKPRFAAAKKTPKEGVTYSDAETLAVQLRAAMVSRYQTVPLYLHYDGEVDPKNLSAATDIFTTQIEQKAIVHTGVPTEGDYLRWQYAGFNAVLSLDYVHEDGSGSDWTINYNLRYYDSAADEAAVATAVSTILSETGAASMTDDYSKVKAIYDWMTENIYYGACKHIQVIGGMTTQSDHYLSAYGALVEKKAVCQGYSNALYRLLLSCGVDSRIITSTTHAWNIANVGGSYYYLDSTWDATNKQSGMVYQNWLKGRTNFENNTASVGTGHTPEPAALPIVEAYGVSDKDYFQTQRVEGTIGTNCRWVLDNSVLTVSAADDSKDAEFDRFPDSNELRPYKTAITKVVFDNLDYVGPFVLRGMSALRSVEFKGVAPRWSESKSPVTGQNEIEGPLMNIMFSESGITVAVIYPCNWSEKNVEDSGYYGNTYTPAVTFTKTMEHAYDYKQHSATCTEPGGNVLECSQCGDIKESDQSEPALGHDYQQIGITYATCTQEGLKTLKCSRCKDIQYETIPAGHDYQLLENQAPTCLSCGYKVFKCSKCKNEQTEDYGTPLGHDWVEESRTPADCETAGNIHSGCSRCSAEKDESIPAISHDWSGRDASKDTPASCTEDGQTYIYCTHCKKSFYQTITALGHKPVDIPDTDTTVGGTMCSECKEILDQPRTAVQVSVDLPAGVTVYINGTPYTTEEGSVTIPASIKNASTLVTYGYNKESADRHEVYPTSMQVWTLTKDKHGDFTAARCAALDNLMTYSGTAIRLTGNQGICIKTSMSRSVYDGLTGSGYGGYICIEYGTMAGWADQIENGNLVHGAPGVVAAAKAYRRGGSYSPYSANASKVEFVNTLVFSDISKTKPDLALRPYMILQDKDGNQFTIYGGILYRNIGYIAWQLRNAYSEGTAGYVFIHKILDYCGLS